MKHGYCVCRRQTTDTVWLYYSGLVSGLQASPCRHPYICLLYTSFPQFIVANGHNNTSCAGFILIWDNFSKHKVFCLLKIYFSDFFFFLQIILDICCHVSVSLCIIVTIKNRIRKITAAQSAFCSCSYSITHFPFLKISFLREKDFLTDLDIIRVSDTIQGTDLRYLTVAAVVPQRNTDQCVPSLDSIMCGLSLIHI